LFLSGGLCLNKFLTGGKAMKEVVIAEKLDIAKLASVEEYANGMVVLKYTNSQNEQCATKLTRNVPPSPDLGAIRP
jgi:hypothetical protein